MIRSFIIILLSLLWTACSAGAPALPETPAPTETVLPSQTPFASTPFIITETPLPERAAATETPIEQSGQMTSEPAPGAYAAAFPDPAAFQWAEVASGMDQPLYLTSAGDGSGRLFVVSQLGRIWIIQAGVRLEQPFLDISDRTTRPNLAGYLGERGLLGLAFHPQFAQNGFFYLNYTDRAGNTHISRFSVSAQDPNRADPASEFELLYVQQPYPNHNGGSLSFGPDRMLYIGLGDGGSGGDPQGNAQSLQTYLGKILRIDVNGQQPYSIPADNPFVGQNALGEIWAYGLRNPWRIAFDGLTGDLYIADVGQNAYEEVNFQPAESRGGENYGWNYREGFHPYAGTPPEGLELVEPVAEYSHDLGCSVSGGVVYRGADLPEWQGVYFYGDYCSGRIWGLLRDANGSWQNRLLFETGFTISSFGQGEAGEVYVIHYRQGSIYRLQRR